MITNKTDKNRSKERFDISKDDSSNILNQTAEILSTSDKKLICSTLQKNMKRLHSPPSIFNKVACITCLSNEGALNKVIFESTGEKMLDVVKIFVDTSLFFHLNTIPNASDSIANNFQYHLTCWVDKKDRLNPIQLIFRKLLI